MFFVVFSLLLLSCLKDNLITYKAQLKLDTASIVAFLKEKNISATEVEPGVWYTIDTLATGIYPALTDSVRISFITNRILNPPDSHPDSENIDRDTTVTVLLSGIIRGMQLGLLHFPEGSSGRLFIASGLAFGEISHYNVPANSNLFYDNVKLVGVRGAHAHLTSDIFVIDRYLTNHSISPIKDPTGIRYTIDTAGPDTNPMPTPSDFIQVTYSGNILKSDTIGSLFHQENFPVKLLLADQVAAWKIILPKIHQGSIITIYVPSGYGYGSTASEEITDANANLIYRIQLDSVIHN